MGQAFVKKMGFENHDFASAKRFHLGGDPTNHKNYFSVYTDLDRFKVAGCLAATISSKNKCVIYRILFFEFHIIEKLIFFPQKISIYIYIQFEMVELEY